MSEFNRQFQINARDGLIHYFGETVTYNPYAGSAVDVSGMWEQLSDTKEFEGGESDVLRAVLTVTATDIPGVDLRDTVTRDSIEWSVEAVEARHGGMVQLALFRRIPRTRGTARAES